MYLVCAYKVLLLSVTLLLPMAPKIGKKEINTLDEISVDGTGEHHTENTFPWTRRENVICRQNKPE